jgi:hypothetical protein
MARTDEASAATAAPAKEEDVVVALSYEPRLPMTQHLDEALARGQFFQILDGLRIKLGRPPMDLRIAIKPDMDFFQTGAATGTSPALVEALVERLAERGYQNVTVIDGCNVDDSW